MQRKNKMLRHIMREGMFYITFQPHSCQSTERLPCVVALPLWYHCKWKLKYQGTFILQIFTFQFTLLKRQLSLLFSEGKIKGLSAVQTFTKNNNNRKSKPDTSAYNAYCIHVKPGGEARMQIHIFMQQIGKDSSNHQAFFFPAGHATSWYLKSSRYLMSSR